MSVLQACGIALSLLILLVPAKRSGGTDLRFVVFGVALLFFSVSIADLKEILDLFRHQADTGFGYDILFKALGIGMISQFTAEICRDAGETVLAGRVEFLAKVEIVLLSLPLLRQILSLAKELAG